MFVYNFLFRCCPWALAIFHVMALENQIPNNGDEILARRCLLARGSIDCFLLVLCTTAGTSLVHCQILFSLYYSFQNECLVASCAVGRLQFEASLEFRQKSNGDK